MTLVETMNAVAHAPDRSRQVCCRCTGLAALIGRSRFSELNSNLATCSAAHEPAETFATKKIRMKRIAIQPKEAHSPLMDTVFPYAFWTLLIVIVIGLAVAILVW